MRHAHEVLRFIDAQERAWTPWLDRLTPEERSWITTSSVGLIKRPFLPSWRVGEWLEVASNLRIQVTEIRWRRDGYITLFRVQDFRPNFVRRVPQMFEPPEVDEYGSPIAPTKEAIEEARLKGSYTASHALAVPDCDEAPTDDAQMQRDRLRREVDVRNALGQARNRRQMDLLRYEARLVDARKKGRASTVAILEAKVKRVRDVLRRAA
jgi:hypothetical protein